MLKEHFAFIHLTVTNAQIQLSDFHSDYSETIICSSHTYLPLPIKLGIVIVGTNMKNGETV